MPEHSYRCACGTKTRIYFDLSQYPFPEQLPCRCGGQLVRYFERAPGISPDIWDPHYDTQLGAWITSKAQREQIAKEKGFEIMGKEEFERNAKNAKPKDDIEFTPKEKALYRESAEKAWNDLKYGNVEVPEMPTVDMAQSVVSSTESKEI